MKRWSSRISTQCTARIALVCQVYACSAWRSALRKDFAFGRLCLDSTPFGLTWTRRDWCWSGAALPKCSVRSSEIEHLFVFTEPLSEEARSVSDSYRLLTTRLATDDMEEPDDSDADIAADEAFEKVFADMDAEIAAAEQIARLEQDAMDMSAKQQAQLIDAGVNPRLFDEPVVPQTLAQVRAALAAEAAKLRRTEPELAAHLGDIDFGELEEFVTEMEQVERELDGDEEPAPPTRATVEAAAELRAVFDDGFSNLDLSALSLSGVSFVGAILSQGRTSARQTCQAPC